MTRWLYYLFIFCPFRTMRICHIVKRFAKWGSKFCSTLTKPSKFCQRALKICQSGVISPNLVTLDFKVMIIAISLKLCTGKVHKRPSWIGLDYTSMRRIKLRNNLSNGNSHLHLCFRRRVWWLDLVSNFSLLPLSHFYKGQLFWKLELPIVTFWNDGL